MNAQPSRFARVEDERLLTEGATYAADVREPLLSGAVHVTYVQSSQAHARILGIDGTAARSAPGVVAVFTAEDVDIALPGPFMPLYDPQLTRPLIAADIVRFTGEIVAIVVSETPEQGEDAAALVDVNYQPLPPVTDLDTALDGDILLFPGLGTNVAFDTAALGISAEQDPALFDDCDIVVTQRIVHQRLAASPLETRSACCAWDADGTLHAWVSCQQPHALRSVMAATLSLREEAVHLVPGPDTGGGFGAKGGRYPEEVLLGWISRMVGRPVRWTETRTQCMTAMAHARTDRYDVTIGGTSTGDIRALRAIVVKDAGAYPMTGAFLPYFGHLMASGPYRIPKVAFHGRSVVTNHAPIHGYRGAGRAQVTATLERMVDLFAHRAGLDPVQVRKQNLIGPKEFPFTTGTGAVYDTGDYPEALARLLDLAGYDSLKAEQRERREQGGPVQLGIGISLYVLVTIGTPDGQESGRVWVEPDGIVRVATGSSSQGQGHATTWSMIASKVTGAPPTEVIFYGADSAYIAAGDGTTGSRSAQLGGSALMHAAEAVVEEAGKVFAELVSAEPHNVRFDPATRTFALADAPETSRTWREVAKAAEPGRLDATKVFVSDDSTYSFGAHLTVVEVDVRTGKVVLRQHTAVDDAGIMLSPALVEGQLHGGIAMGLATALQEEMVYTDDGTPVTTDFNTYAIPSPGDLINFAVHIMQTPTPRNPLGAKGVAEAGTVGAAPAAWNAVLNALAPFGVDHIDMPLTAEKVWAAIARAS